MCTKQKVFISYKYADNRVLPLPGMDASTVRDYVNYLEAHVLSRVAIQKWEQDGESLQEFADSTIATKLRDKIYDSSITLVLISPGMREIGIPEKDQWIPWEINYSLKATTRHGRMSHPNGIIAIRLPDRAGSYDYAKPVTSSHTSGLQCSSYTDPIFTVLRKNSNNSRITPDIQQLYWASIPYVPPTMRSCIPTVSLSYIVSATWYNFIAVPDMYLSLATDNAANISNFDITYLERLD